MKYAVIDIGSNSVRIMLDGNNPVNKKMLKSTQLAKGMVDGILCQNKINETATAVKEFFDYATINGYQTFIFATEAVRSAKNGNILTDLILQKTGIVVDVIKGEIEAKIGFLGACGNTGNKGIIDVGGASSEIAAGKDGNIYYSKSLPYGVVRIKDKFGNDVCAMREFLRKKVTEYEKLKCDEYIAISGTATSLSAMMQNLNTYDPFLVHDSYLSIKFLAEIIYKLYDKTPDFIANHYPVIGIKRAEVIVCGAVIMLEIANYLGIDGFKVSDRDNTEGYLIYKEKISL